MIQYAIKMHHYIYFFSLGILKRGTENNVNNDQQQYAIFKVVYRNIKKHLPD